MLSLIVGIIIGILVVFAGMKTLIATTRYLWKYSIGILLLLVIAVVLMIETVNSERRYNQYLQTQTQERMEDYAPYPTNLEGR